MTRQDIDNLIVELVLFGAGFLAGMWFMLAFFLCS